VHPAWSTAAEKCSSDQREALKSALAIGRILGRVVILPRFRCADAKHGVFHDCPLNSLYSVPSFDSEFNSFYRESSFLHHRQVPDTVRSSMTSQLKVTENNVNETSSLITVKSDELIKRFGAVTDRILRLESLYNVRVKFVSDQQQQAFDSGVQKAFRKCGYRGFC
jgi:hypothetical protein